MESNNDLGQATSPFVKLQNKFRQFPLLVVHYMTKFEDVLLNLESVERKRKKNSTKN